jgi:hypothetical protein
MDDAVKLFSVAEFEGLRQFIGLKRPLPPDVTDRMFATLDARDAELAAKTEEFEIACNCAKANDAEVVRLTRELEQERQADVQVQETIRKYQEDAERLTRELADARAALHTSRDTIQELYTTLKDRADGVAMSVPGPSMTWEQYEKNAPEIMEIDAALGQAEGGGDEALT